MDQDDPVIDGFLLFPPPGNVLNKITKKKTCQPKYCMLFKSSKQGIERLEVYDNKEDVATCSCLKIIPLKNCIKISRTSNNHINIVTKSTTLLLSALTEDDSVKWLNALQSVAFKEDNSKDDNIDEDNDLYCSSSESTFHVTLCSSEASIRSGLEPTQYNLCISRTSLRLVELVERKVRASWPYKYIRRYGCRQGIFAFEAGRKCETGEGTFHFERCNHQEIFRCLSMKIKYMKKKMYGEASPPPLELGERLQAAISMEPRSRSPFPLSTHSDELNLDSITIKTSISSHQSADSQVPLMDSSRMTSKPKPVKPPRKHIFTLAKDKFEHDFSGDKIDLGKYKKLDSNDSVSYRTATDSVPAPPYDHVEVRSDAWKTMGLCDSEQREYAQPPGLSSDCGSVRLVSRSRDDVDACGTDGLGVTMLPTRAVAPADAAYDRLQYFTSVRTRHDESRLEDLHRDELRRDTCEDYEEVEGGLLCAARIADDSHLGYGILRRPGVPGPQVPPKEKPRPEPDEYFDVDHCRKNGNDYAIVSKPKRV